MGLNSRNANRDPETRDDDAGRVPAEERIIVGLYIVKLLDGREVVVATYSASEAAQLVARRAATLAGVALTEPADLNVIEGVGRLGTYEPGMEGQAMMVRAGGVVGL